MHVGLLGHAAKEDDASLYLLLVLKDGVGVDDGEVGGREFDVHVVVICPHQLVADIDAHHLSHQRRDLLAVQSPAQFHLTLDAVVDVVALHVADALVNGYLVGKEGVHLAGISDFLVLLVEEFIGEHNVVAVLFYHFFEYVVGSLVAFGLPVGSQLLVLVLEAAVHADHNRMA